MLRADERDRSGKTASPMRRERERAKPAPFLSISAVPVGEAAARQAFRTSFTSNMHHNIEFRMAVFLIPLGMFLSLQETAFQNQPYFRLLYFADNGDNQHNEYSTYLICASYYF
ncbi:hypothetical protein [Treponema endosymbiont of Eucomonympha sp.]|uniref:hypothetical protein n=1 Tax=Treponema endosymbiont of Eucomonympha sp. TaxID=1580831 RepID=UPI001396B94C|nr:hypothetical protein [Treponema endosymbiont of Eucomonympha sp.]